jgi:ribA/ribD-fused uncharacterized protein
MIISKFSGKYKFLSNIYPCNIVIQVPLFDGDDRVWPSVEHLYQALKCELYFTQNNITAEKIKKLKTPRKAKNIGKKIKVSSAWKMDKIDFMERIVDLKFKQNKKLRQKLLATGNALLINSNTYGDTFWGKSSGRGKNCLGKILMNIRKELRNKK